MNKEQKILAFEKLRWSERIYRNATRARADIRRYLASKSLGRNFNESMDEYLQRTNFTQSYDYLRELSSNQQEREL
jgi:hypothetical protein